MNVIIPIVSDYRIPNFSIFAKQIGLLAQLVQSTALTGQGSLVRIQYSPRKENQFANGGLVFFYGFNRSLLRLGDEKSQNDPPLVEHWFLCFIVLPRLEQCN